MGSGALTRSAVRTPTMTLMTDMQAQMELLQRELDVAKAALLSLSPAPAQNEVARRPTAFEGTAVGVVEPTGGCMAAGSSQAAPVTEDAADVVARAQAMMEEAMTAAQEITTKASVAVDSAAELIEAHPAAAQDVEAPVAVAVESAADVVERTRAMMQAFEAAQTAAETVGTADDIAAAPAQRVPVAEAAADVLARADALEEAQAAAEAAAAAEATAAAELAAAVGTAEAAASEPAAAAAVQPVAEPVEPEPLTTADVLGALPSARLPAMAVVQAQLQALQRGAPQQCFEFTSPSARRQCSNAELFGRMVSDTPAYQVSLLHCTRARY